MQKESSSDSVEKWLDIAKCLIEKGADVNTLDDWKQTPLHLVDSVELARLFIEHGANINALDNNGRTPLHTISNAKVAQLLVDSGADTQVKDVQGKMPIFQHLEKSRAEIVRILVDNGAGVDAKGEVIHYMKSSETASENQNEMVKILQDCAPATIDSLRRAVESMSLETVRLMVSDQQEKKEVLSYYLCIAAKYGEFKAVEYLINRGSNINEEYGGKNPLEWAVSGHHLQVAEALIKADIKVNTKYNSKDDLLFQYVSGSKIEMMQFLVNRKINADVKDEDRNDPVCYAKGNFAGILTHADTEVNTKDENKRTTLCQYVLELQTKIVEFLIEIGANVKAKDKDGNSPIHYANENEIMKILIDAGADINAKNKYGETLLIHHVRNPNTEIVQFLLDNGADVNFRDKNQNAPIHCTNDRKIMEIVINAGADVNVKNQDGITPLIQSIKRSDIEIVQLLVNRGADINARNERGYTPIHYIKDKEIAEFLISHGADINAKSVYGRTPLFECVEKSLADMVQFLIEKGADVNARDWRNFAPIHCTDERETMEILIAHGADVNTKKTNGVTPLFRCVEESLVDMVQFLIEKGADVNARDKDENAPIHFVKDREIAKILISHGADINAKSISGRTPLFEYVDKSLVDMVQFLIEKGVDVNIRDNYKNAPIHYVNDNEIMKILIAHGAEVDAKDGSGKTPLFQCVLESRAEMVQLLLDKGVDVNAIDKDGRTPIKYAKNKENKEIIEILINAGADANVKNVFGETPQIHHVSESQSLGSKGADKAIGAIGTNAHIHHIESAEIVSSNSGSNAGINVKYKFSADMGEVVSLASEISTVVGIIHEKHQQAKRCKTQCQMLAESIMGIHELLKKSYAILEERKDIGKDLKRILEKFLSIIRDVQDIIDKHCNVSSYKKVFLTNEFEGEFEIINQRLRGIKDVLNTVMNVEMAEGIHKIATGMSNMNNAAEEANKEVKIAVQEAKEGFIAAKEDVKKAKDSEVFEIPIIEDSEIMLDEEPGPTGKVSGALKELQPIQIIYNKIIVEDKRKLEIMWKLSSCEGILTLYGLYKYKDNLYLVTERTNQDHPTLDLMIKGRPFFRDWGVIRSMSLELANAIGFMHECKILHKAICSNSICVVDDRHVRIYGFEYARYMSAETDNLMGARDQIKWMAPERLKAPKPNYDEKCDIYSLGAVMWSLATHEVPFDKLEPTKIPSAVLEVPEYVPKELATIIEGCIDRDREKRWTIKKIIDELSKLVPENLENKT